MQVKNALRSFTIPSCTAFEDFLVLAAEKMNTRPAFLMDLGYIGSWLPKSPKPIPKLLDSDECWGLLIREVYDAEQAQYTKQGQPKKTKKSVFVTIIDTGGSVEGNGKVGSHSIIFIYY